MKTILKFETEDEERAFWATHDSTDYVNWRRAKVVLVPGSRLELERLGPPHPPRREKP